MPSHATSSPLRRRSVLQLFLSSGLGLSLAACGGGSDDPEQDQAAVLLKNQADAAVSSGLVGMVLGQVSGNSNAGYVLAAATVEARTGSVFETVFDDVLVQPLALQGAWRSMVPDPADIVWGYEGAAGALAVVEATEEALATKDWLDIIGPAGNWACTGEAYVHWLHWHVRALQGERTPLPGAYVNDLRAAPDGRYLWGWKAMATPKRMLLTRTGHEPGFMAEVVVDRAGAFAVFGLSNTGHVAEDGTSWVLGRIDQALADVLQQQSITL